MNINKRVALYARVSTEEQATEGFSIQVQVEEIEAYARNYNMEIVERYIGAGASVKSIAGRPEMKRLLKDINENSFNTVIVYKVDRIARKTKDALEIAERCEQANVSLMSIKENFDIATPMGKMIFQLMSNFSEFERNSIVERGKMGMIQRAKEGYFNGGRVLGYDSVNKQLVINDNEAHIVKLIFQYAEQNLGYKAIVSRINAMGYKTKRGVDFSINTIKTILDNPIYIGKIRFNMHENWSEKHRKGKNEDYILVDGKHEAIISEEQWNRVQHFRQKRSIRPTQSHSPFILSGLLKCPQCGYGMVPGLSSGSKGKKYRYYVCGKHHNMGKTACKAHSIRADRAEQEIFDQIKHIVSEPYILKRVVKQLNENRSSSREPINQEIKVTLSNLNKVKLRIDNITNQLIDDPSLVSIFKPKLKELTNDQITLNNTLEQLNTSLSKCDTTPIDEKALLNLLLNIEKIFNDADPDKQKSLLRLIIKDIQISKEASRKAGRKVEQVNLYFDFTIEGIEENTLELFSAVRPDYVEEIKPWMLELNDGKSISEVMASLNILPLKDVRFTPINPKRSIYLLQ